MPAFSLEWCSRLVTPAGTKGRGAIIAGWSRWEPPFITVGNTSRLALHHKYTVMPTTFVVFYYLLARNGRSQQVADHGKESGKHEGLVVCSYESGWGKRFHLCHISHHQEILCGLTVKYGYLSPGSPTIYIYVGVWRFGMGWRTGGIGARWLYRTTTTDDLLVWHLGHNRMTKWTRRCVLVETLAYGSELNANTLYRLMLHILETLVIPTDNLSVLIDF
jgi:hypothetical protein